MSRPGRTWCWGAATRRWPSALLVFGALRQRELERSILEGVHAPLPFGLVAAFTIGGVLLVAMTVVLVAAQI